MKIKFKSPLNFFRPSKPGGVNETSRNSHSNWQDSTAEARGVTHGIRTRPQSTSSILSTDSRMVYNSEYNQVAYASIDGDGGLQYYSSRLADFQKKGVTSARPKSAPPTADTRMVDNSEYGQDGYATLESGADSQRTFANPRDIYDQLHKGPRGNWRKEYVFGETWKAVRREKDQSRKDAVSAEWHGRMDPEARAVVNEIQQRQRSRSDLTGIAQARRPAVSPRFFAARPAAHSAQAAQETAPPVPPRRMSKAAASEQSDALMGLIKTTAMVFVLSRPELAVLALSIWYLQTASQFASSQQTATESNAMIMSR